MSRDRITVFLVDDQSLFRRGLRMGLAESEDVQVVGESPITDDVPELVESFSPHIVLIDASPPHHRGLDMARRITQRSPNTAVIVLTSYEDDTELFQAIKSGAAAYLSKRSTAEDVVAIMRRVREGDLPVNESVLGRPGVAQRVLRQFQDLALSKELEALAAPLSQRELEVLRHVAQGHINKEIAHLLGISEQTVKNHITSILRKLDVNDRTQAVLFAVRHGWISLEHDTGVGAVGRSRVEV